MIVRYANPNYDPVKAHEYYEKHKKLKGRKKGKKTVVKPKKKSRKSSGKKSKKVSKASKAAALLNSLNEKGKREAEIEKQKIANEKKDFLSKVNKQWKDKIKELEKQAKTATGDELENLKTQIATLQVDCKAQKDLVTKYYNQLYVNKLTDISNNKEMRE